MNKDYFKHYLQIIAKNVLEMQQNITRLSLIENEMISIRQNFTAQTDAIKFAVCTSIGLFESENIKTHDIIANYRQLSQQNKIVSSGFDNQRMENLRKMIIELNIKGSIRIRQNGLIELRSRDFGSVYGRTEAEIEEKLKNKLKEMKKNKSNKTNTALLSEFYHNNYLPYKKASLAPNSIKAIESNFKCLANFDKPLNKYTALEIENFLYSIPHTRKRQVLQCLLNNLFNYAKRLEFIKNNPCDNVEKMKHSKKVGRALSFQDQCAFFNALYSTESKASEIEKLYLTFVYLTGTRRNEALSITKNDIKLSNNIIHIPGTKTKTSDRNIPMFPLVKKLLQTMESSKNKVFDLTYNQVKNAVEKITSEYHLHELRHTFGTICICVQKLDPKTVALYMGHSDPFVTLNTYTHPEQLNEKLFFDGSISDKEKLEILNEEYSKVLKIINDFLDSRTQIVPKK